MHKLHNLLSLFLVTLAAFLFLASTRCGDGCRTTPYSRVCPIGPATPPTPAR